LFRVISDNKRDDKTNNSVYDCQEEFKNNHIRQVLAQKLVVHCDIPVIEIRDPKIKQNIQNKAEIEK